MRQLRTAMLKRGFVPLVLWALFLAGLLVQAGAPRLHIEHNAFAIPESLTSNGTIRPADIVARERWMQTLSAVLTLTGALGLAICCRVRRQHELREVRVQTSS